MFSKKIITTAYMIIMYCMVTYTVSTIVQYRLYVVYCMGGSKTSSVMCCERMQAPLPSFYCNKSWEVEPGNEATVNMHLYVGARTDS